MYVCMYVRIYIYVYIHVDSRFVCLCVFAYLLIDTHGHSHTCMYRVCFLDSVFLYMFLLGGGVAAAVFAGILLSHQTELSFTRSR